jgi:hypothetical protein
VVDPPAPLAVDQPPYPGGDRTVIERARFLHATSTRIIAPEFRRREPEVAQQTADVQASKPQKPDY